MKTRTILELTIIATNEKKYFTSLSMLTSVIENTDISITAQAVRNYFSQNKTNVFENDKIRIEKDILLYLDSKNRKIPPEHIVRKTISNFS